MPRIPILIALAGLAVTAAGCGGKPATPGVARIGTNVTTTTASSTQSGGPSRGSKEEDIRRFSVCMRANGVPNFPDPQSTGRGMSLSIDSSRGIDPNAPRFKAAQKTCEKLLPNGGKPDPARLARDRGQMLKFSACMRKHGLPSFPDPTSDGGGIQLSIGAKDGLNPKSPVFQAAQKACEDLMPGPKIRGGGSTEMRQGPAGGSTGK
jgi:hypothetical protein